jgi:tetratricopeptide (TPR) repeat protein
VLRTADGNQDGALAAYDAALSLDPSFANARYLRALLHYERGDTEKALNDLRIVAETNTDNQELQNIISTIASGAPLTLPSATSTPVVSEVTPATDENGAVVSDAIPESDVVTPVNQVPDVAPDTATGE